MARKLLRVMLALIPLHAVAADLPGSEQTSSVVQTAVYERVAADPNDAAAWRLQGRLLMRQGHFSQAVEFLKRAVALNQLSAAAWHDLGRALEQTGDVDAAGEAYQRVIALAPESTYADSARQSLEGKLASEEVIPASIEIRDFDGLEHQPDEPRLLTLDEAFQNRSAGLSNLRFKLQTGLLYDSNVALSPISRQLAPGTRNSFQFFFSPYLEYLLLQQETWRGGPRLAGHFTWNEEAFQNFNLQSYRPGWFVEKDLFHEDRAYSLRVDYEFTHDEFRESTFGNRHAVLTSLTGFWDDVLATNFYWATDYTNFANDGSDPSTDSSDGWTNALGVSHEWRTNLWYLLLVRLGGQLERADTRGTDFRFNGVGLNAEAWFPVSDRLDARLRGGWGYRDYPDFRSGPSRNDHIWTTSAVLLYRWTEKCSVRLGSQYIRFNSESPLFDAERFVTDVALILEK